MVTIRDVALRAGVSTATVSRVLNHDHRVRPETSQRVLDAVGAMRYVPNSLGRSLRQQRSALWALIIADIENPFLTGVTRGVEDIAQAAGYSVLLCNSDESPDKEQQYLDIAEQGRVTGVLITPTSLAVDIHRLQDSGVPVVALDRPVRGRGPVDTVLVDSRGAARVAVEHLISSGHRRIACITGPRRVFTAEERALGYREALDEAGLPTEPDLIQYADFKIAGGRDAARTVLETGRVDALLVANSLMAVGVLEVIDQLGLKVGTDVAVVAFDDAPWTSLLSRSITVVRQPAYELGRTAGELLLEKLSDTTQPPRTIMLSASVTGG